MKKTLILLTFAASFCVNANSYIMNTFGTYNGKVEVSETGDPNIFLLEYPGKQVFHDCTTRLPRMAIQYVTKVNQSTSMRDSKLYFESEIPPDCQPKQEIRNGINYALFVNARGLRTHIGERLIPNAASSIVTSAIYDDDIVASKTTNFVPLVSEFRRGPWYVYTKFVQCLRGQTDFLLINGVINKSVVEVFQYDRYGVITPDFIWSVMLMPNGQSVTFLFSNQMTERRQMAPDLTRYLISMETLEKTVKFKIPNADKYNKQYIIGQLPIDKTLEACSNM